MRFLSTFSIVSLMAITCITSCGSKKSVDYDKQLDTIGIMLTHADQNLALDPEQIQLRVDTMQAKLLYIDSLVPGLVIREDEVGLAYSVYRNALIVFIEYVDQFDALYFENQSLQQELVQLRSGLKENQGEELQKLESSIPAFRAKCAKNYSATKVLIRRYLDVIRPYYRKKKVIDHLFTKLVENNSVAE
ncbi:MAG: hypothetical protein JXQ87_03880 [Bacteroidia bacterium]